MLMNHSYTTDYYQQDYYDDINLIISNNGYTTDIYNYIVNVLDSVKNKKIKVSKPLLNELKDDKKKLKKHLPKKKSWIKRLTRRNNFGNNTISRLDDFQNDFGESKFKLSDYDYE